MLQQCRILRIVYLMHLILRSVLYPVHRVLWRMHICLCVVGQSLHTTRMHARTMWYCSLRVNRANRHSSSCVLDYTWIDTQVTKQLCVTGVPSKWCFFLLQRSILANLFDSSSVCWLYSHKLLGEESAYGSLKLQIHVCKTEFAEVRG
jgi:hypothetical protein